MFSIARRHFLAASAAPLLPLAASGAPNPRPTVALIHSSNRTLRRPSNTEDTLDYERVRDMVWSAIRLAPTRAGRLENSIRPGAHVVVKPNVVSLRGREIYRTGDITDFRVTRAVIEYLARFTKAARITLAEGGSYRRLSDPAKDNVVYQGDTRRDLTTFDWGPDEFPGFGGSLAAMLRAFQSEFTAHRFDYVDLSYDAVRDRNGNFLRLPVPTASNGTGAFGARPDYFVTNTIRNAEFLITVPVMKVHLQSGITCCLKNYVGTAPRQAYAIPGTFHNANLHSGHSVEDRIDPFIVDLAAFHPPDFCVVDGLRGLQYTEHSNGMSDQMVQSNLVLAAEDPVATDALVSHLLGFNPWDMEFLHMAAKRGMGIHELSRVQVAGDDPDTFRRRWAKPRHWHGRANRWWRATSRPDSPIETWPLREIPTDTLYFQTPGSAAALARISSEGHRKAFLRIGANGRFQAFFNGVQVLAEDARTTYRTGQFHQAVELRPGVNELRVHIQSSAKPKLSAFLSGPRNDGDTVDGIRYLDA